MAAQRSFDRARHLARGSRREKVERDAVLAQRARHVLAHPLPIPRAAVIARLYLRFCESLVRYQDKLTPGGRASVHALFRNRLCQVRFSRTGSRACGPTPESAVRPRLPRATLPSFSSCRRLVDAGNKSRWTAGDEPAFFPRARRAMDLRLRAASRAPHSIRLCACGRTSRGRRNQSVRSVVRQTSAPRRSARSYNRASAEVSASSAESAHRRLHPASSRRRSWPGNNLVHGTPPPVRPHASQRLAVAAMVSSARAMIRCRCRRAT
jgi:hypothetical protein